MRETPSKNYLNYELSGESAVMKLRLGALSGEVVLHASSFREGSAAQSWWSSYLTQRVENSKSAEHLTYVDMFSGVGGLSLGFSLAASLKGFQPTSLLACDLLAGAREVYEENFEPKYGTVADVTLLTNYELNEDDHSFRVLPTLAEDFSHLRGKVDVVLAGPPCQGHSNLNNKTRRDDPRNRLYLEVPAFAIAVGARSVIIENVPGVVLDKEGVVESTKILLEQAGYFVQGKVIKASSIGWPQTRSRYFLIATKLRPDISLDQVTDLFADGLDDSLWWLIKDLEGTVTEKHEEIMLRCPPLSSDNRKRLAWYSENSEARNLPNYLRPPCQQNEHTRGSSYGRMDQFKPAPTLTTGLFTPGRGRFIHPVEERMLSAREAARIQGFPDWFNFSPTSPAGRTKLATWIGNAVPSILGFAAGLVAVNFASEKGA